MADEQPGKVNPSQVVVDELVRYINQSREATFENEKFAIGVLQAVSGGSLVAVLAQLTALQQLVSPRFVPWFVSLCIVALLSAVLASYFKHEYKLWDLKAQVVPRTSADEPEFAKRSAKSSRYLKAMRWSMRVSIVALFVAFVALAGAMWARQLGCL